MASGLTSIASRHPSIRVLQIVLKLTLRVLAPDVFLRQLTALTALIIVRHALWRFRRWIRSLTRQIPFLGGPKGRLREELRLARRKCKDYGSFQHIGEKLDRLEGKDRWKRDDNSSLFDSDRLRERTKRYREMMESNDVYACMYALRGELLRKHFGICNPALFQVTNTGTKVMIEKYVETICEAMAWVGFSYNAPSVRTDGEAKKEAIRERLAFFNETKHGFGRSALLLSGGASVGMYHFGVVKALHMNGLLPRVMSGTSAGSIVCGMLGVRTDEELMEMWQDDFSWSDNFSLEFFGGKDLQRFSRTGEELYSSEHLGKVLRRLAGQHSLIAALTPSQNGAVLKALQQRLSLVQGPPGTGKTHVACAILAAWASIYCSLGERILAVADSNVAADNIYVRLQKMGIECTRVGQGKEVDTLSGDALFREVQRAKIVVATCIGSGMEVLTNKNAGGFQRVLVDECTQACEPSVLVPLGRQCEQVVLIGDHAQLPATVLSKAAQNEGLGLSLFERMVTSTGLEPTLLLEQRRMHSSIADFPNHMFYSGQLMNAADDSALEAIPGFAWPNPDCRVAFVDVSSGIIEGRRGFSTYNTAEAEAVASVLENIINAGYPPDQIVVLTAYLAQKQELQRAIRDRGLGRYLTSCHVDTIDGYQGMEQGLVLFSATRNNESNALGFLADNRRMNVMLTRAKQGLIVFGNQVTLQNSESVHSKWPAWLQWVEGRNASMTVEQLQSRQADAVRSRPSTDHHHHQSAAVAGLADDVLQEDTPQLAQPAGSMTPGGAPQPPRPPPVTPWQQVYSSEYKAYYYWNKDTNLTQWEEPPSFLPAPP